MMKPMTQNTNSSKLDGGMLKDNLRSAYVSKKIPYDLEWQRLVGLLDS